MKKEEIIKILNHPHFQPLQNILTDRFGKDVGAVLEEEIYTYLGDLLEEHKDDGENLREESHCYILPAIAIYRVLRDKTDSETAIALFREIFLQAGYEGAKQLREKAKEPGFYEAFAHRFVKNKRDEQGGFLFRTVEDSLQRVEFHVLRCPYCTYCEKYRCKELVPVFCECDDIVYGNIHPNLIWGRTTTLGRGQELCDFRFDIIKDLD